MDKPALYGFFTCLLRRYVFNNILKDNIVYRTSKFSRIFKPCRLKVKSSIETNKCHDRHFLYSISSLFVLQALAWKKTTNKDVKNLIAEADELYEKLQYESTYELLYPHCDSVNDELLWRLARALFEKSKNAKDDKERLHILEEACEYVLKAVEINEDNGSAHRWSAILVDSVWKYKSTKGRLEHTLEVRRHMERAVEINPNDATSYYLLGEWCYTFADLPWYQRKAASLIFAKPPSSTFEEALHYFEEAEKVQPNFYSMNLLLLGKTYLKLNQKENAINFLKQARDYPQKTSDDCEARKEAMSLLKQIGVKD